MEIVTKLKKSTLFKNTFIYTSFQFINKGIPFLLLPILTKYLSTYDYGIIAIYNTLVGIIGIFISLSMPGAIGVNYFQLKKEELQSYIGSAFNILIFLTFIMTCVINVFQEFIFRNFSIPIVWIYMAVAMAFFQTITQINLTLWRSQQRSKPFALYEISQTLVNIIISLFLIIVLKYGWEGRLSSIVFASILFGILSMIFIYKRGYLAVNHSIKYFKDVLKFGIPLIPHQLAVWMRAGVDILLITMIIGKSQTGLYSVGYTFGSVIGIFALSFNNAYSPYLFKKLKCINSENKKKIVKFTYMYFIGIIVFALLLSSLFSFILPYFLADSFQGANKYIFWITLAYAFNGMYLMVVNYIFYVKKTYLLSMITISMSIFHVILSYFLINIVGAIGAAYATCISFSVTFVLVWYISNKVYPMPWILYSKESYLI